MMMCTATKGTPDFNHPEGRRKDKVSAERLWCGSEEWEGREMR